MAQTAFASNDPRTQEKWAKDLFRWVLPNMWLTQKGLMGTTGNSVIQVNKDLTKGPGDKITFELEAPLEGAGQGDDGQLMNNAEALRILNFQAEIHEIGNAVASAGKMSEKRTMTSFRESAKYALGRWFKERLENQCIKALSGLYNESSNVQVVNENEPTSDRIVYIGQTTAGVLSEWTDDYDLSDNDPASASVLFGTQVISAVRRKAMLSTPKIRPIIIDGAEHYVMLIHPWQAKALRGETAWLQAQREANLRGNKNPIFSGAIGIWDGVILHELERIEWRSGAGGATPAESFKLNAGRTAAATSGVDNVITSRSVARALFLGAQAGVLAWGQMPSWSEDYMDVKPRKPIIGTDAIYGISKTIFNSHGTSTATQDFAVIAVDTQVVPDTI